MIDVTLFVPVVLMSGRVERASVAVVTVRASVRMVESKVIVHDKPLLYCIHSTINTPGIILWNEVIENLVFCVLG